MTIFEHARLLGEELLKTKEVERLLNAKKVFEADEEAVALINEYSQMQSEYQEKLQDINITKEEYEEATNKMMEKGTIIKNHAVAGELINAQNELNNLINKVFSIVTNTMSGEEESQCGDGGCSSGCCSTCNGCH